MDAASLLKFAAGDAKLALRAPYALVSSRRSRFSITSRPGPRPFSTDLTGSGGHCFDSSSKRRARGPIMAAKKAAQGSEKEEGRYKHTVDLPKTTFGLRANSVVREPEIQKLWEDNQVFQRVVDRNTGGSFVLHDGPPYANGNLHMGHALNKVLKDIINRYKLLRNYKVHFVPGWDCHGLPIELKGAEGLELEESIFEANRAAAEDFAAHQDPFAQ